MTDVLVDLAVAQTGGGYAPAKGTIYVAPARRYRDGTHVVITQEYGQVLVAGVTTFTALAPGVWRFREDVPNGGGRTRTVMVPDDDTVNYGDLDDES